jgi:hypothetical protein
MNGQRCIVRHGAGAKNSLAIHAVGGLCADPPIKGTSPSVSYTMEANNLSTRNIVKVRPNVRPEPADLASELGFFAAQ